MTGNHFVCLQYRVFNCNVGFGISRPTDSLDVTVHIGFGISRPTDSLDVTVHIG